MAEDDAAEILGFVLGEDAEGEGGERDAEDGIVALDEDGNGIDGGGGAAEGAVLKDAFGLPRLQALGELLGVGFGVAGEFEGLDGKDGGGRVVAVGAAGLGRETGQNDVGLEAADDADHVADDFVAAPDALGVGVVFGETEIEGAGEKLLGTIEAAAGEEFLSAGDAEFVAELGADDVLTTVAAGEGEVGGAVAAAAGEPGEELGVFVVGMGGSVKDGAEFAELAQVEEGGGDGGRGRGGGWRGGLRGHGGKGGE